MYLACLMILAAFSNSDFLSPHVDRGNERGRAFDHARGNRIEPVSLPAALIGATPLTETEPSDAFRVATEKASSPGSLGGAWPEGFNAYFGAALHQPHYDEVLNVLVSYVNRRALSGVEPEDEAKRFRGFLKELRKRLPKDDPQIWLVEAVFGNLVEYVRLENAFADEQSEAILRDLVKIVESQNRVDPNADDARTRTIVETIQAKGLFVPSTILFGQYILPWRPMNLTAGLVAFEVAATPEFRDDEHTAEAVYDFITPPGPVCRVDFETVGAAKVVIERGTDGQTYRVAQEVTSRERGGVRGPIILQKQFSYRYMKIRVEAPAEQAVLRSTRVFALKESPVAVCGRAEVVPLLDASFKERAWPMEPQVRGFVSPKAMVFVDAQTTARLCRTPDALYLAVYAREPRVNTMAAAMTGHDSPLWEEECIDLTIEPKSGQRLRFAVNPLGTRFESRNGEAAWNAEWKAVVKKYPEGWAAEIAIPFSALGVNPKRGDGWGMDISRARRNVTTERSRWAWPTKDGRAETLGRLIFN